jgi:hypothetical protein
MKFVVDGTIKEVNVSRLIIAGWTGRNAQSQLAHIEELMELGIAAPTTTPMYYNVGKDLLTQSDSIDVVGKDSSGEVEIFLITLDDGVYIGVASDHTDRKLEAIDITLSKQNCPKPVSTELWRLADVAKHWDSIVLRSYLHVNGDRRLYQEAPVANLLPPHEIVEHAAMDINDMPLGSVIFCGTVAVFGGLTYAKRFEIELFDPVINRRISHCYSVRDVSTDNHTSTISNSNESNHLSMEQ